MAAADYFDDPPGEGTPSGREEALDNAIIELQSMVAMLADNQERMFDMLRAIMQRLDIPEV